MRYNTSFKSPFQKFPFMDLHQTVIYAFYTKLMKNEKKSITKLETIQSFF